MERLPVGGAGLLAACLALVAVTTALLNLDTAAVFLTPVLLHAARRRGAAQAPFLYGTVMMVNASSLFLPGANLTNLLVLAHEEVPGATFAVRMLPLALTACLVTAAGILLLHRRVLHAAVTEAAPIPPWRLGPAVPGAIVAVTLMLGVRTAASFVAATGLAVAAAEVARRRASWRAALGAINAPVLLGLFALSVALGTLARHWSAPGELVDSAGRWETAGVAALAAIVVNNLPAAVLLSARPVAHPRALLLGLGVGPNLFVTGSLSAYLWWQAARSAGARPTLRGYVRHGIVLAPAAIVAALLVAGAFSARS